MDAQTIDQIQQQFFCCVPLNKFNWLNSITNLDAKMQKQIIASTINHPIVAKYPVRRSYKIAFLKHFIETFIERSQVEDIDDEVYQVYCEVLALAEEESGMSYRHFMVSDEGRRRSVISVKESMNMISDGTTGLCCWQAAFSLADWCLSNKPLLRNKSILELGSGAGLTGLTVVAHCQPSSYYFSDCHPAVMKNLRDNVQLNLTRKEEEWSSCGGVGGGGEFTYNAAEDTYVREGSRVRIVDLKWQDVERSGLDKARVDVLLAADVVYDRDCFAPLATVLSRFLGDDGSFAVLAATVRNEATIDEFLSTLGRYDLAYEEETTPSRRVFLQPDDTPVRILRIFKGASCFEEEPMSS